MPGNHTPHHQSRNSVGIVQPRDFSSDAQFECEDGSVLQGFSLRYETYGTLNKQADNAILICHPLTADHHAAGYHSPDDRKPGWWDGLIGPGAPVDTNRFFVICSNCLGGCQGSTGPSTINPATGKKWGLDFPPISIRDMVRAQKRLIDHLKIPVLNTVIGGSMGGMQALQWAVEFPDSVARALIMAVTGRQSTQAIAFNEVGRAAIMQDPNWNNGNYNDSSGPATGLAVARMMAHITYLSDRAMETKFGRARRNVGKKTRRHFDIEFEVESYLRHQGRSFVNRFDANTYLYFTKALDRFDLYGDDDGLSVFNRVSAECLVVGFKSDWLYPTEQNRRIVRSLLRLRKRASYAELNMDFGHDSFLIGNPDLLRLVRAFMDRAADESQ